MTQRKRPAPPQNRPSRNATNAVSITRRREASWRLPVLESGRSDPWYYEPPTNCETAFRSYEDAARHLLSVGLTPAPNLTALHAMWKSGGQSRRAAQVIAARWGLAA